MSAYGSASTVDRDRAGLRIWLADLTYTQQTVAADVMPNAIGGIAAFVETQVALRSPIRLFKYPERLAAALNEEGPPDVIGFSNYIWNSRLAYGFAQRIKRANPRTVTVFGGPNYPVVKAEQEDWLRCWPSIDFVVIKEGELALARLIAALVETGGDVEAVKRRALPSIHAITSDGSAILTGEIERIRDLTEIPSPYTTGRLDEFFDGVLLPIVQTNRGCPFSCTFCVEGVRYFNKVYRNAAEKIDAELDYIGRRMKAAREAGGRNDLFIADSNFGMYADDLDTCRALARVRHAYGWPEYINVATGKNKKERVLEASRIIDGALRLSGSVQSLDRGVLRNIKRDNISPEGLMDLGLKAGEVGANTYSEVILALPGDSLKAHFDTVRTVIEAGFTNIYLFQLMLLPGTEIATNETKARYGMVTRYRVLPRCYGHFDALDGEVRTAEIEEICVANNTLTFDEYLACRRMHLVVTLLYNDGIFGTLLKLMRMLHLPVFRWIEIMLEIEPPAGLGSLFESFLQATRQELWADRSELEAFIAHPGIVEKFIAGELGNNLLFVYKTIAVTRHIRDVAALARTALRRCLAEASRAEDPEIATFIDDALAYHCCCAENLFSNRDAAPTAQLHYDIPAFEAAAHAGDLSAYRLDKPRTYRFTLDESQSSLIERYLAIYGATPVGIGRILSKVYVKKLFRHAAQDDGTVLDPVAARTGDIHFHLAGLQN